LFHLTNGNGGWCGAAIAGLWPYDQAGCSGCLLRAQLAMLPDKLYRPARCMPADAQHLINVRAQKKYTRQKLPGVSGPGNGSSISRAGMPGISFF
jgi:hypothetical protein